jgi:hypothetical protein
LLVGLSQGTTIESLPIRLGRKSFEVLIGTSVEGDTGRPNDSTEIEKGLFIDAVILEELRVVSKISKKPVESPQRSFRAVQPAGCFGSYRIWCIRTCAADRERKLEISNA